MTKLDPALASNVVRKVEKKQEERVTSQRSYNEKKAAYDKLINVDMPENTKRIEFARSYGDLSENAEYQYAKDEQRALLQKQTLMQKDLDEVKPVFFDNVEAD
jgi:transcription elongation GreA/GreB family factor